MRGGVLAGELAVGLAGVLVVVVVVVVAVVVVAVVCFFFSLPLLCSRSCLSSRVRRWGDIWRGAVGDGVGGFGVLVVVGGEGRVLHCLGRL